MNCRDLSEMGRKQALCGDRLQPDFSSKTAPLFAPDFTRLLA